MRSSKKNHGVQAVATVLAFALSILGAGIATAPAYARSCAELGHHQGISNKTAVFIAGPLKRVWLSPGGTYTVEANKTLTVTGSDPAVQTRNSPISSKRTSRPAYRSRIPWASSRDGVGPTTRERQNGFSSARADTNSIIRDTTWSHHAES